MKREIFLSSALHLAVLATLLFSSPFDAESKINYDDVIRVSLTSIPAPIINEPIPIISPDIPEAITDDFLEIPIDDPTVIPEKILPKKDKPKPKKNKPKKKQTPKTTEQPKSNKNEVSGTDSPFQNVTIDNLSFDYPYWFKLAFNKISRNWRNPVSSDGSITCTVYFQVIKSGRLINVEIVESSRIPAFDDACIRAIKRSAPFPNLPNEFLEEIIGITLPFQYQP